MPGFKSAEFGVEKALFFPCLWAGEGRGFFIGAGQTGLRERQ